jgi:diadenosine tetraphosphate (Ap4A) HIT family hydrolase
VAAALRGSGLDCQGVNLFLADEAAAEEEVFHTHLHVIPRYRGDGFESRFPSGYPTEPHRSELDATAKRIKEAL